MFFKKHKNEKKCVILSIFLIFVLKNTTLKHYESNNKINIKQN